MRRFAQGGFSLLEVLLATAILLGCVIVLSELANIGREHANSAHDLATVQRLCQNKLNELLSGMVPLEDVDSAPLEEEEGWLYSVALETTMQPGVAAIRVTVSRDPTLGGRAREFTLVRWIAEPNGLAAGEAPPSEPAERAETPEVPAEPSAPPQGMAP